MAFAATSLNEYPSARRQISSHTLLPIRRSHERVSALMAQELLAQDDTQRTMGSYAVNFHALLNPLGVQNGIFSPIHHTHAELAQGQRSSLLINLGIDRGNPEDEIRLGRLKLAAPLKGNPNPLGPRQPSIQNGHFVRHSRRWDLDYDN